MENEYYVKKHYLLQHGCFFSTFYNCETSLFTYSDLIHCFIWNHSVPVSVSRDQREQYLNDVVQFYNSRNRQACVYLDAETTDSEFLTLLNNKGFQCIDNEAWMLWSKENRQECLNRLTMYVVDDSLIEGFLNVCSSCFEPDYSDAIKRDYTRKYPNKSFIHFVFYLDSHLVGIGSCYYDKHIAIIHNIGVVDSYRRKGFGTEIVHAIVQHIEEKICLPDILLQCDGGGYIEDMYKKIGFKNVYRRFGYVCKDPD